MRLFVGLPIPIEIAQSLIRTVQTIDLPKARWTAPEKYHLTLVFLGEVDEDRLPEIKHELAELDIPPLQLKINSLGSFSRTGVVFAEVESTPGLLHLQAEIEERMVCCGFIQKSRPYRPHITLAHIHRTQRLSKNQFASLTSQVQRNFRIEAINLYRSHLSAKGSSYEILAQKRYTHE